MVFVLEEVVDLGDSEIVLGESGRVDVGIDDKLLGMGKRGRGTSTSVPNFWRMNVLSFVTFQEVGIARRGEEKITPATLILLSRR